MDCLSDYLGLYAEEPMYRFDTSERYRWMSSGRKSDIALRVGNLRRRVTCLRVAESARQVDLVASITVSVQAEPAEDFQVVYFDLRGHGRSHHSSAEFWNMRTWADDLRRLDGSLTNTSPRIYATGHACKRAPDPGPHITAQPRRAERPAD
jgi:hypothetical protein